ETLPHLKRHGVALLRIVEGDDADAIGGTLQNLAVRVGLFGVLGDIEHCRTSRSGVEEEADIEPRKCRTWLGTLAHYSAIWGKFRLKPLSGHICLPCIARVLADGGGIGHAEAFIGTSSPFPKTHASNANSAREG